MAERKADRIADDLLRRVVAGELAVGSLLPKEDELAARYGVQRGAVREAVKQLEVHRLVAPVRRKGTVVLDPLCSLTPEVLRAMLLPREGRVEPRMFAHFLELRCELDGFMNELAARSRDEADLAALERVVDALAAARLSPRRYAEAAEGLALTLARATHNPIFEMLVHWQRHITRDLEDLFLLVRLPSDAHLQGVRALIEAIRARDGELAKGFARAFYDFARPVLLEAVANAARAAAPPRPARAPSKAAMPERRPRAPRPRREAPPPKRRARR